jgi:hypothetical protein
MNSLPGSAQFLQVACQDADYPPDSTRREAVVLAERDTSGRSLQIEDGLATASEDVDVYGAMIVRIDHYP